MPVSPVSNALKSAVIVGTSAFCWKMMGEKSLTRTERVISAIICGAYATRGWC